MSDFLKWLVVFLVFSPIFVVIGACALGYYSAMLKPSDETIRTFLEELKFPANVFYYKYEYNVLSGMGSSPFQYIKEATLFGSILGIIVYSIVPIIFTVGMLSVISKGGNGTIGIFWIIVEVALFSISLRFGSKLRRIEQSKLAPPIS